MAIIKSRWTAITKFAVIKPTNDMEYVGEILTLSFFGEYCPERSLRGYNLMYLLSHLDNYKPVQIVQRGETINLSLKGGNNEC